MADSNAAPAPAPPESLTASDGPLWRHGQTMMQVVQKIGAALRRLQNDAPLVLWSALPSSALPNSDSSWSAEESQSMQLVRKVCTNLMAQQQPDAVAVQKFFRSLIEVVRLTSAVELNQCIDIVVAWLKAFIANITAPAYRSQNIVDESQIRNFLLDASTGVQSDQPSLHLQAIGCDVSGIPRNALAALYAKLSEPDAECIISSKKIMTHDRVTPGLSCRIEQTGGEFYCFVYSTTDIVDWLQSEGITCSLIRIS